jgi:hypothetical protein
MFRLLMWLRVRLGPSYRRWRKRLDNPEVRAARLVIDRLRTDPPDVVFFGSSETMFVSPKDSDLRTLPQMIDDELGPDASLYCVQGAGYHPKMFHAFIDLMAAQPPRPLILVTLGIRLGFPPWHSHPVHSYPQSLPALRRVDPTRPTSRIRAAVRQPKGRRLERQLAEHDKRPYPTWVGDLTVGDYRRPLKNPTANGLSPEEAKRLIYAYHHGGELTPDDPWLECITSLGRALREHGFPAIAYDVPIPVEEGTKLFGPVFVEQSLRSFKAMNDAFIAGYGPTEIVEIGTTLLGTSGFINPDDGIEHFTEEGRSKIAARLAPAILAHLRSRQRPAEQRRDIA